MSSHDCSKSIGRTWEGSAKRVTRRLEHVSTVRSDSFSQDAVMTSERGGHRIGVLLPQLGAALNISEKEGDCAGGWAIHGALYHKQTAKGSL